VSLKVLPRAPAEATLKFSLSQVDALRQLNAWGGQPLPLNASRWLPDAGGTMYLRLRGAVAAVDAACRTLGGERVNDAQASSDWDACREQRLPWFDAGRERDLWRLSVPQTAPVLDLPEPTLVEWHGAQRWVHAAPGQGESLRAIAARAGGHATLFRAADSAVTGRQAPLAPALASIQRELQRQFDPAGIFNPGRLFPQS
jgi:glycolate oxidase FAD binding subunit